MRDGALSILLPTVCVCFTKSPPLQITMDSQMDSNKSTNKLTSTWTQTNRHVCDRGANPFLGTELWLPCQDPKLYAADDSLPCEVRTRHHGWFGKPEEPHSPLTLRRKSLVVVYVKSPPSVDPPPKSSYEPKERKECRQPGIHQLRRLG